MQIRAKFADYLIEDNKVRDFVKKKLYVAGVSKIVLERAGRKQTESDRSDSETRYGNRKIRNGIDELKGELEKMTRKKITSSKSKK